MRAVALHADVLLVTSAVLQVNCVIVRAASGAQEGSTRAAHSEEGRASPSQVGEHDEQGETFVVDSPVLPEELESLPALLEQARFPAPSGLLATHGDWDHLLGRLAFPGLALGCAESTAQRLTARPGDAQRALRDFDEELAIERPRPLALGSLQALPVPGRCDIGARELELHQTGGHTVDGMAIAIPWARVLVAGDYLSALEIPIVHEGGGIEAYLATLERLRPFVGAAEHVVPGHGKRTDSALALELLEQDVRYLHALREHGAAAELPPTRSGPSQRRLHAMNVQALEAATRAPQ